MTVRNFADFSFIATQGDKGAANPLHGELLQQSGTLEAGFNLTSYTGTFTMWQVHYRGSCKSDPSTGTSGAVVDTKAARGEAKFIADEHNGRKILFLSGRGKGNIGTISDTTASGSLITSTGVSNTFKVRSGDEFLVYSVKVSGSAASITNATAGQFQYTWGANDLNTVGEYMGEFRFSHTSTANKVIHFPIADGARRKIRINVEKALSI